MHDIFLDRALGTHKVSFDQVQLSTDARKTDWVYPVTDDWLPKMGRISRALSI